MCLSMLQQVRRTIAPADVHPQKPGLAQAPMVSVGEVVPAAVVATLRQALRCPTETPEPWRRRPW